MILRALFSAGCKSNRLRVARSRPEEPVHLSRRAFLTFSRTPRRTCGTWRVTIDAGCCTDCNACTRICNEQALHRSEGDSHVVYSLDPASCTGCRDCEVVCAAKALSVWPDDQIGSGMIDVVSLPMERCSGCGQTLAGVVNDLCPVCRPIRPLDTLRR